jgi:hypothetical protein
VDPLQLTLIVVGGIAELAGIAFAVREAIQRRAYVRDYQERPRSGTGSGVTTWTGTARGTAPRIGDPPTVEKRLDAVERDLEAMRGEVAQVERRTLKRTGQEAARLAGDAQVRTRRQVDEVRDLLLKVTEPNRQVWASLGLLVLGVVLQSVASALGVNR